MVEHLVANERVASSNLVSRSRFGRRKAAIGAFGPPFSTLRALSGLYFVGSKE